jgi:tetratricopeptide (TPR) repeat protein
VQAYQEHDLERAIDCFTRALKAGADPTTTHIKRARAYQKLAEKPENQEYWFSAREDYEVALDRQDQGERDIGRIEALIAFCDQRKFSGDAFSPNRWWSIVNLYKKAIDKGFDSAAVNNNLAFCYLKLKGTKEFAEGPLQKAMTEAPSEQAPFRNFAICELFKAGPKTRHVPEQGMIAMKQAILLGPCDKMMYKQAAMLFALASSRTLPKDPSLENEVLQYLKKAIDLGLEPADFQDEISFGDLRTDPRFLELLKRKPGPESLVRPDPLLDPGQDLDD